MRAATWNFAENRMTMKLTIKFEDKKQMNNGAGMALATPVPALTRIGQYIFTLRSIQVMVDRDLAMLYQVPTRSLNEQVHRNKERFPDIFMFQLTTEEKNELITNCSRFRSMKHSATRLYAFTEPGVAILSSVLQSKRAAAVSIQIMEAFAEMRKFISAHSTLFRRLEVVEKKQVETDHKFERIISALENRSLTPSQGIFYNGEVFDAYYFVTKLIKSAKKSIVLIDNYIDETVLHILSKRSKETEAIIYTPKITKGFQYDLDKHNSQYAPVTVKVFRKAHDRFLVLDAKTVYHIGASLKDAGKKWFAFSKMNLNATDMIERIQSNE